MKATCPQPDLATHLGITSRIVPARPNHPILGSILLEANAEAQKIKLIAFDLSLGIETSFPAQIEGDTTTMAIPAKIFNQIVGKLPKEDITIEIQIHEPENRGDNELKDTEQESEESDGSENKYTTAIATLVSTSGKYEIRGTISEGFPELPSLAGTAIAEIPANSLYNGMHGSVFAASSDETKQVLNGIHLVVSEENLECASTDGHRLAIVEVELESNGERSLEATIPTRAWRELERILGLHNGEEPIQISLDPGQAAFEIGEQRLTTRTLEGQYPLYWNLIPETFARTITCDRKVLASALELISTIANQNLANNIAKLSIDEPNQKIYLMADAQEVGSGYEALEAEIASHDSDTQTEETIAFNVKYLSESLKNLPASQIQLKINDTKSPAILTPNSGEQATHLIMPVAIRS